jgi:hypothetical protein
MEQTMRRIMTLGLFLLLTTGCQGIAGPWVHKQNPTQVDNPHLTISEQERLGRDRLALPDPNPNVAPHIDSVLPRWSGTGSTTSW